MNSSPNVLFYENPMFWESDGCQTILDNGDKSKDSVEPHWTLEDRYVAWMGLEYISPVFDGDFNKQLSIPIVKEPYTSICCCTWKSWCCVSLHN